MKKITTVLIGLCMLIISLTSAMAEEAVLYNNVDSMANVTGDFEIQNIELDIQTIQVDGTLESNIADLAAEINGKPLDESYTSILGDERIQITIDKGNNESAQLYVIIENSIIKSASGSIEGATIDLYVSEATYLSIRESPNQMQASLDAYNNGQITKDAHGFGKSIKFALAGTVLKIMSWFS